MNSKFAKMALPGLVMGLALGLSVPAVSFAQDDHHDRGGQGNGGGHSNGGGGEHGTRGGSGGAQPQARSGGQDRGTFVGARTQTGAAVNTPAPRGDAQARVGAGGQPGYHGQDRGNDARGASDRGDYRGNDNRGGDNRGGGDRYHGTDRGNDRGGYRDDRGRGDRGGGGARFDWHGDSRFNGYGGTRAGFYFAPGRGYYHVPDQYYGHHWGRGEFLPRFFFSYRVYDPDYYDLPYPPYGCAWMFVGEDAVLVDLDTGQIVDVIYGVF